MDNFDLDLECVLFSKLKKLGNDAELEKSMKKEIKKVGKEKSKPLKLNVDTSKFTFKPTTKEKIPFTKVDIMNSKTNLWNSKPVSTMVMMVPGDKKTPYWLVSMRFKSSEDSDKLQKCFQKVKERKNKELKKNARSNSVNSENRSINDEQENHTPTPRRRNSSTDTPVRRHSRDSSSDSDRRLPSNAAPGKVTFTSTDVLSRNCKNHLQATNHCCLSRQGCHFHEVVLRECGECSERTNRNRRDSSSSSSESEYTSIVSDDMSCRIKYFGPLVKKYKKQNLADNRCPIHDQDNIDISDTDSTTTSTMDECCRCHHPAPTNYHYY